MWTFLIGKYKHLILFHVLILVIMPIAGKSAETLQDPDDNHKVGSERINPGSGSTKGGSEIAISGSEDMNRGKRGAACGSDGASGGPESLSGDSRNTDGSESASSDAEITFDVTEDLKFAGGVEIVPHSFPWLVWVKSQNNDYQFCGGIIIGPSAVATSEWCAHQGPPAALSVTAGDHDRNRNENSEQRMKVKEIKVVQKIPGDANVELALLKMTAPFKLNRKVQIAKIPDENYKRGKSIVAVGWGSNRLNKPTSIPRALNFTVIPEDKCEPRYQGEFCADAGNPEGSAGCPMDIGAPAHEGNLVIGLFNTRGTTCGQGGKTTDVFVSTSLFAKEIEDFSGNSPRKCNSVDDVLFGVATNLMADICDQTKKFEETKEIQPPLINDLNNTIDCAHVTWTKSGHGCFDYLCPNNDDW